MDELLALLERYAPGYSGELEGYAEMLVDELAEVFGRPLPAFYQQFAQVMGVRAGPLLSAVGPYDPLLHVADLYRVAHMELPPRRFLYIFGDPDPLAPTPYWLDLDAPSEEGDCQVVRMPLGKNTWKTKPQPEARSLRELLFLWAMEHVHLPTLPHQARYMRGAGHKTREAEDLARVLQLMGFARLPYPQHSLLFEQEGAAAQLYRPPGRPHFTLLMGTRHPEQLKRFHLLLEDNTDLEPAAF